MERRKAFTLIELLVVIAIIGVLMAILMPALNRVKKSARATACLMGLHQWSYIWSMYCDDNEGYFPDCGNIGWRRGTWILALRPLWRTRTDILRCPVADKPNPDGGTQGSSVYSYRMGQGGAGDLQEQCSYGMNCWLYKPQKGETEIQNRPTEYNWARIGVPNSGRIPVFIDSMWRGGGPMEVGTKGDPPEYFDQWAGAGHEMKHFCIDRHNGRVNVLFLDWSSRKVDLKELWTLKWHRQFNTAGPWTKSGGVQPGDWPDWMRRFKEY